MSTPRHHFCNILWVTEVSPAQGGDHTRCEGQRKASSTGRHPGGWLATTPYLRMSRYSVVWLGNSPHGAAGQHTAGQHTPRRRRTLCACPVAGTTLQCLVFYGALVPSWVPTLMTSSRSHELPKAPPPKTIVLDIRVSIHETGGRTNIQSVAVLNTHLMKKWRKTLKWDWLC